VTKARKHRVLGLYFSFDKVVVTGSSPVGTTIQKLHISKSSQNQSQS